MAILGGRFFCGWLCPLGAIQDIVAWFGGKIKTPKYKGLSIKGFNPLLLKYPVLLLILLTSIFGYGAMLAGLSPWRALQNFPKITSSWGEMRLGFIILGGTLLASLFLSRFFCRYLCPLGAAQALLGSISFFSLKYNKSCDSCNSCMDRCPVGIKLSSTNDTISPECIRCLNCIGECKVYKGNRIQLKAANKNFSIITYATVMLVIFIVIWLGMPKLWDGNSYSGNILQEILTDGTYQGEAKGFAGEIITEISIKEGKITNIEVIEHQESKGWYEEAFMALTREIIEKQKLSIDGISGATKTSVGLIKSIERAIKKAQ
jgi:polyferredoxin